MTDESIMPIGKYKGEKLANIPAHYLLWLYENTSIYGELRDYIKDNFDEKNDDEVWRVITRYGLIRKPLRDFKKHYINYSEEIEFSKSQLTNLKADIKNNILTEDLIEQYIKEEAEFVNYLNLSVGGLMEITNNYYQQYLELNPLVEKFINEKKI